MEGPGRTLLTVIVLAAALLDVSSQSLQTLNSAISSNATGFLVHKGGRFYLRPALLHQSRSAAGIEEESVLENESSEEEESWITEEEKKTESGLHASIAADEEEEKAEEDDNYVAWQRNRRWWWRRWIVPPLQARGFSIIGILESAFSSITKFIGNIMNNEDGDEEIDYENNGVTYKDHQLLRLTPKNLKQVRHLQELKDNEPDNVKFWTIPAKDKITDILISPIMINDVKKFLREKKIDYVILISDLQKVINSQNPRMPKERRQDLVSSQGHSMTWKRYHRYKDIMGYLDHLAFKYPHIVEVLTIGKSFEGRALKIIKISTGANKNGEQKPSIWIDAGMHAREWISTAVATYILNQLVEKNENYTRLLDITDWIIMPIANPDGYEFTHTDDRLWRKTRSTHDADADTDTDDQTRQGRSFLHTLTHYTKWLFGTCEGVDPNRNFNVHWGEDKVGGASKDPCHDTYAGPSPFSEPETRAIANYIMENRNTLRTYLTLHSYSQMLLVPWGFTRARPADFDDLMNIANKAKSAIAKVHGTEYKVGAATELLYPTTGSSDDWAKAIAGIKNAFTMELRDRGAYGYLLPASQIIPTARETWAGVRVIARMAANTSNTSNGSTSADVRGGRRVSS